jgi:hypothetical protein
MAPVEAMVPAFLSAAAIGSLWLAWRGRGRRWLVASIGCGLAALPSWVRLVGAEFGVVYTFGATALGAWAWIALTATRAGGKVAGDRPRCTAAPSAAALLRGLGTALLTGPLALGAVLVACLHLVYWLPAGSAARWVTAGFALPVLWATLATLLLCADQRGRAALAVGVVAGLGTLVLPSGSLP